MQVIARQNRNWRQKKRPKLDDYTETECKTKFRLPKETIKSIAETLHNDLASPTNRNNPISPECQVNSSNKTSNGCKQSLKEMLHQSIHALIH